MGSSDHDSVYEKTYASRMEGALLDHVRKQVDAETRAILLDSALRAMQLKVEELEKTLQSNGDALNQAISGLKSVTLERDAALERLKATEARLSEATGALAAERNALAMSRDETAAVKVQLDAARADAATSDANYRLVLDRLESLESAAQPRAKKKATKEDSGEWVG